MTTANTPDKKIVDRVRKLLALAADGGATQAEAELAAERAREIMAQHGITNATVEAGGGQGEVRVRDGRTGHVGKAWMREIMRALAEQSFVLADWHSGSVDRWENKRTPGRWELWGRESAVITVKLMHEYLVRTVDRAARERGTPTDEQFKAAMGERIAERLHERHQQAMEQQAKTAREQQAAAQHPASSTHGALVVVLEDYAQKEQDANRDLMNNWVPGTSERLRLENEAARVQRLAEYEARLQQRAAQAQELRDAGHSGDVVSYVLDGFSLERAQQLAATNKAKLARPETEAQRRARERREEEANERYWARMRKEREKQHHPSRVAGRMAGDRVGLDAQVGRGSAAKKLGG